MSADENGLKLLSTSCPRSCNLLTVEIEHVDADALEAVVNDLGVDVQPSPRTLRIIQVISDVIYACITSNNCIIGGLSGNLGKV